jgi:hypothetical protein
MNSPRNYRVGSRCFEKNSHITLIGVDATNGDQLRTQDQLNFNRWLEVTTENNQTLAAL